MIDFLTSRGFKIFFALLVAALLITAPFYLRNFGLYLIAMWLVISVAALGLNLTLGYAGQVSMAQGAFVGIGAYVTGLMTLAGVPWPVAFLCSGLMCFVIGWVLGYPALRVQHHYLAFVTLAFSTLVFLLMRNEEWLTKGIYGLTDVPRPILFGWNTGKAFDFYFFVLGVVTLLSLGVWWIIRSPWGRAFIALRENPVRALSLGVDTRRYTLMAFAMGSAIGGFAGALYAPLVQFFEPNSFALPLSLNLLLMVIVGGGGTFFGPFIGAATAVLLPEWLRIAQGYYLIIYAIVVMVLMLFCPTGIMGLGDRFISHFRQKRISAERAEKAKDMSQQEGK